MGESEASLFGTEEYDVTNCALRLCCGSSILHLESEEAVLHTTTCIDTKNKRLPYGELGSVEHNTACGCLHTFDSALSDVVDGKRQPIIPGCGCEGQLVSEIVEELKARMKGRGDTGNIQRAEDALRLIRRLVADADHSGVKVDAVLAHLGVQGPPAPPSDSKVPDDLEQAFRREEYDVTDCCTKICCCGSKTLTLEAEEVVLHGQTCGGCASQVSRRPYGQLQDVAKTTACGCCVAVSTSFGSLSPGCGCAKDLVEEIVFHLQTRMKARGDTGNIRRQEETIRVIKELVHQTAHVERKVDAIMGHLRIALPPRQASMT